MKNSLRSILSAVISTSMLISAITVPITSAEEITLPTARGDADLRFTVVSDAHLGVNKISGSNAYQSLDAAFDVISDYETDLLVMNGDMVLLTEETGNATEPYDHLNELLGIYYPDMPYFYTTGNHEFMLFDTDEESCAEALANFETEMNQPPSYHYETENGYHFVTVTTGNYYPNHTDEQLALWRTWLEEALADDPTKPVFMVEHHPIADTLEATDGGINASKIYPEEFMEFLRANPRIIQFSGHMHTALQNPRTIYQDGATHIESGYLGGDHMGRDECDITNEKPAPSHGLIVEVNDNIVEVYRMDLKSNKVIGEPWVIDITQNSPQYTSARYENPSKPTFPGEITVKELADTYAIITFPKAVCEETDEGYQDGYVEQYRIKAIDAEGNVVSNRSYQADYYAQTQDEIVTLTAINLERNTDYTIEVYAENPLGGVSDALTKEITTPNTKTYLYENPNTQASLAYYNGPSLLPFVVEDTGVYAISASLSTSNGNGELKASVVDFDNTAVLSMKDAGENVKTVVGGDQYLYLEKGLNTVAIKNNGRGLNDENNNWLNWDYVKLVYIPEKTVADLTINVEAEDYIWGTPSSDYSAIANENAAVLHSGNTLAYNVTAIEAGQYEIVANAKNIDTETRLAEGTISCDNDVIPFSYDYTDISSGSFKDITLGTINLAQGENEFSMSVSSGVLATDYFLLKKTGEYENKTHFEAVPANTCLGYASEAQELTINAQKAGVYAVSMKLMEATGGGRVKLSANGQVIAYPFNNGDSTEFVEHNNVGYVYLNKGANKVYVQNDSKGDNANFDYWMECNLISFDYAQDKTKADCKWLAEAEILQSGIVSEDLEGNAVTVAASMWNNTPTIKVNVPEEGQYKLSVNARNPWGADASIITGNVSFYGKETDFQCDYTDVASSTYKDFELGSFHMAEGENAITINITMENGAPLILDYFMLEKIGEYVPETHYEIVNTNPYLGGFEGTGAQVTVEVQEAGVYAVSMNLSEITDGGRIKATANGQVIGYEFNGDTAEGVYEEHTNVGYFYLNKGENTISLCNDSRGGTNHQMFDTWAACNLIKLDYQEDKTIADCKWLAEAEDAGIADEVLSGNATTVTVDYYGNFNSAVQFPVTVPEDGEYKLFVSARDPWREDAPTIAGNIVNGLEVIPFECDFTNLNLYTFDDFEIGTVKLGEGENIITLEVTNELGCPLTIDYFMLQKVGDYTYDRIVSTEISDVWFIVQDPAKEYTVNIPKTGVYALSMSVSAIDGGARFKVTSGNQIVLLEQAQTAEYVEREHVGYFYLEKGDNVISIRNDGKGGQYNYYDWIACNRFDLSYVGDKTIADVAHFVETEDASEANERCFNETPNGYTDSGVVSVLMYDDGLTKNVVNVPVAGRYTLLMNARNRDNPTSYTYGTVKVGDVKKSFYVDFSDSDYMTYTTEVVGTFDFAEGENVIEFANQGLFIDIDYFVVANNADFESNVEPEIPDEPDVPTEDPIVTAVNEATSPDDIKAIMEENKDTFTDYDERIANIFYPEALYEQFIAREFADVEQLTAEWNILSTSAPAVDLQIKTASDADFVGGKTALETGEAQVVVEPYKVDDGVVVIAAVYENGMLIGYDNKVANGGELTLSLGNLTIDDTKSYTFKLMYWGSMTTMLPFVKDYNSNF